MIGAMPDETLRSLSLEALRPRLFLEVLYTPDA